MNEFSLYRYDEDYIIKKKDYSERDELLRAIQKTKNALTNTYQNFDFVTEPDLVDAYIFELKALQIKYSYLLQQAKELGIYADKTSYIV